MPIYEYVCLSCNIKFDCLVRSGDEPAACQSCNSKHLKRVVSSFAFRSKDRQGNITSSSSNCGGCASHNCSSCSR